MYNSFIGKKLDISILAEIIKGNPIKLFNSSNMVGDIVIDSRKGNFQKDDVFFCIKGPNHDGHRFINESYAKGIRQFVVEKSYLVSDDPKNINKLDVNLIVVKNSIEALQNLASYHRKKYNIPIVAITGSNGKTIIKEWLAQCMDIQYNVVRSPKSYNSQIGVPLSMLLMNESHNYGIFEAGVSKMGEMQNLEKILKPQKGIFCNIGAAHEEGFLQQNQDAKTGLYEKTREKALLFKESEIIYYCKDYEIIDSVFKNLGYDKSKKFITWSIDTNTKGADYCVTYHDKKKYTEIEILRRGDSTKLSFEVNFKDPIYLENATHVIVFLLNEPSMDKQDFINKCLKTFKTIPFRLSMKKGIGGCQILDDSYSNDIVSLRIALEYMSHARMALLQKLDPPVIIKDEIPNSHLRVLLKNNYNNVLKKSVIVSDFLQIGVDKESLYKKLVELLKINGISRIICIGKDINKFKNLFNNMKSEFYLDTDSFMLDHNLDFKNELILVKGARGFKFERVVNLLQQKSHNAVLEVNLDAMSHNLNFFKSVLAKDTKIMAMVKASTYGSSDYEVPLFLQHHRIDCFAVASVYEGIRLRNNGITFPIMILNSDVNSFNLLLRNNLEPSIYSLEMLREYINFTEFAEEAYYVPQIHIKLDTGMHRLGFLEGDIVNMLQILQKNPHIKVKSIYSHLASSEDEQQDTFTLQQINLFDKMFDNIVRGLGYRPLKHILNSNGVLRFTKYQYDMVRVGIGLHGVGIIKEFEKYLEPVNSLKTIIAQIKHVKKGESVGYNRKYFVDRDSKIGILPIGYADGLSGVFGNGNSHVLVGDKLVPIIGNICMDMCMVDLTDVVNVEIGNNITIFGKGLPINKFVEGSNISECHFLSQIQERVKRVYTNL